MAECFGQTFPVQWTLWWRTTLMNDHCSFTPILFQSLPFTFCYVNEPTPETTPLSRPLLLDFVVPLFSHVRIMEEVWFPGSAFYYFVKVVISLVTLVALFQAKVQFTVAQWADTSIDEVTLVALFQAKVQFTVAQWADTSIDEVTLVALFQAKVQFTVAQWADTSIDEVTLVALFQAKVQFTVAQWADTSIDEVTLVALFQAKVQFTVAQWADTSIDEVTLVALFQAKVQFTVAQWADTSLDEHSLMSCMWACFPDGFPHHAWTAVSPLWLCWVMGICVFSCSLPPALLALQLGSFICYCGNRGGVGNWSQNKESALKVYSGEENSPTISWPGWNPHPSDHKSGAVALGCILSIWDACKWLVLL